MSTKTTDRRTPLSLSGATTMNKMNNKPSPGPVTENRKELTNQKTDLEKSTNKDNTNQDKKTTTSGSDKKITNQQSTESNSSTSSVSSNLKKSDSSLARDSPRKDTKSSQNGVSGKTNGNSKDKVPINTDNSAASKVEKTTSVKEKQTNSSSNAQQNNEKTIPSKEKPTNKNDSIKTSAPSTEKSIKQNKDDLKKSIKSDSPLPQEKKNNLLMKKQPKETTNSNETNNVEIDSKISNTTNAHPQKKEIGATNISDKNNKKSETIVDLTNSSVEATDVANNILEKKKTSEPSTPTRTLSAAASIKSSSSLRSSPSVKSKKEQPSAQTEDVEMMESLAFEVDDVEPIAIAASTPGKIFRRKEGPPIIEPKESSVSMYSSWDTPLERKPSGKFLVSGRRSIHPLGGDYKSMQGVYRKMKTDLDGSCNTNTSLNVTVGSEVPNNSSFSFFGHGRKRDRTPPNSRSELADTELSPKSPKRARIDVSGFLSAFASPITLLRSRFSKTSIQSSTPVKMHSNPEAEKPLSTDEEIKINDESLNTDENQETECDATVGKEEVAIEGEGDQNLEVDVSLASEVEIETDVKQIEDDLTELKNDPPNSGTQQLPGAENTDDIKVTVTPHVGDKKRQNCNIM